MKKLTIILTCLFLTATLWSQGQKRALTFEDMFAMGRLSTPVVSPDGRWVVFAVKIPDIAANTFQTDLYAVDLQGRGLKKL
ncbi:MAG TPA: S9 family peptidase, partial [Acidobacteriota bacterium]